VVIVVVRVSPLFLILASFPSFRLFLVVYSSPSVPGSSYRVTKSYSWLRCGRRGIRAWTFELMKETRVRRMLLGTRQRFPVQAGTGAKAPPDTPCETIPAAFHARLVLLKDETPSFLFCG
jgi:hypothetical protein